MSHPELGTASVNSHSNDMSLERVELVSGMIAVPLFPQYPDSSVCKRS